MKKWILTLGVSFLCFSSFATDYELGSLACVHFEEVEEEDNKPNPRTAIELLYAQ